MKAGIIGVPDTLPLGTVESDDRVRERYGQKFHTTLNVQRVQDLGGNTKFVEGTALHEEPEDQDVAEVEPPKDEEDRDVGRIRVRERTQKNQTWADFVAVEPRKGHNGFVAVSTSAAEFVFDVVGRLSEAGPVNVQRATVSLGDFVEAKDHFTLETGGGTARGPEADTVMTWGQNLEEDQDVGRIVRDNLNANTAPMVSGRYMWDAFGVHCNVAQSGWVEVWSPDWDTYQYLRWVEQEVLPFMDASPADQDGDGDD